MKLKTLLILVLITLPGMFNSFKAQFVYSNKYNNFVMAAYNEEIFDRQYRDLESRIITYDLSEKLMFLSSFSPCAVRSKIDTLYYKNDTISQELIIRKIDDRRIYFALSSQKIHQNVKVTLLYLIILTLLQKQISLRMGRCIQSLNIGVKISLYQCQ